MDSRAKTNPQKPGASKEIRETILPKNVGRDRVVNRDRGGANMVFKRYKDVIDDFDKTVQPYLLDVNIHTHLSVPKKYNNKLTSDVG